MARPYVPPSLPASPVTVSKNIDASKLRAMLMERLPKPMRAAARKRGTPEQAAFDKAIVTLVGALTTRRLSDATALPPHVVAALATGRGVLVSFPGETGKAWTLSLRRFVFSVKRDEARIAPVEVIYRRRSWRVPRFGGGSDWIIHEEYLAPDGTWQRGPPDVVRDGKRYRGKAVEGYHRLDVPCNEKCIDAVGPRCECACGGANHGAGPSEVWVPVSAVDQITALVEAALAAREDKSS